MLKVRFMINGFETDSKNFLNRLFVDCETQFNSLSSCIYDDYIKLYIAKLDKLMQDKNVVLGEKANNLFEYEIRNK